MERLVCESGTIPAGEGLRQAREYLKAMDARTTILQFRALVDTARRLLDAGYPRGADHTLGLAFGLLEPHLLGWGDIAREMPRWIRETQSGNGFEGTMGFDTDEPDQLFWTIQSEDGWSTVGWDAVPGKEGIYWGGEIGSRDLGSAVAQALLYQVRWPEARIRIARGPDGPVVLEIPPAK